ncbi:hypothetical protein OTUT144_2096, partial [Orientia tsutsugamushi str. UT144]
MGSAGSRAPEALKELLDLLEDSRLKALEAKGINFSSISNILGKAGSRAPEALKELLDLLEDSRLKTLEAKGI